MTPTPTGTPVTTSTPTTTTTAAPPLGCPGDCNGDSVITIGEMIVMPTSQTLAAGFARTDMRGRYMAVFGLGSTLGMAALSGLLGWPLARIGNTRPSGCINTMPTLGR